VATLIVVIVFVMVRWIVMVVMLRLFGLGSLSFFSVIVAILFGTDVRSGQKDR
jgi:hypothetical protein